LNFDLKSPMNRPFRAEELATVGKRIRSDVEHSHDERSLSEVKHPAGQDELIPLPVHLLISSSVR